MRGMLIVALLLFCQTASAVDWSKVNRKILDEPDYQSDTPKYCLVAFGPKAETKVWMVLDSSKKDLGNYDVLYADLNANGKLTDKGERFTTESTGGSATFKLPDFADPTTGQTHTEFTLRTRGGESGSEMVSVLLNGEYKFGGGYPTTGTENYNQFAKSADEAPILWIDGSGPFGFQRWYSDELEIGGSSSLKLFLGLPGQGHSTFCAFQRYVLEEDEQLQATLIYEDAEGKTKQTVSWLKERC